MKILFLNQIPEVNNKYTFSLVRSLRKQNVDITVCGMEDDDVSSYQDIPFYGLIESYSKVKDPFKKVLSYKRSWDKVWDHCKNNKIQILHVQWYICSPIDCIYIKKIKKAGIKVVATIHDMLPFNKKFYDFYYHKKIYGYADKIVNQALMNKDALINDFNVPEGKIVYIPHGHYMEYAEMASKKESALALGLPADRPMILFFGQIKKVKGLDILIKSMRKVVDRYPDILCVIAGKVWKDDFSVYQDLIERLQLSDNIRADIRFIKDDEIKYYFNAADILALPYRQIYQSGVLFFGYAYEKPIVATTEGEFLTVIKDKETGLLVPAGDPDKFAEALIWYLDHPDKGKEFAKAGKEDVCERFSWDAIAERLIEIYRSIWID